MAIASSALANTEAGGALMPGHLPSGLTGSCRWSWRFSSHLRRSLISEFDNIARLRHFLGMKRSTVRIIEIVSDEDGVARSVQWSQAGAQRCSASAAVEEFLGELVELHAGALAVGQHRVDPRPRAADRRDPVQGVLAAEDRERARACGQPDDGARVAQQHLLHARVVLVAG